MKAIIRNSIVAANLILAVGLFSPALAEDRVSVELKPMQAHTVTLENYTAVVYYTVMTNGQFQVTTTIGPNVGYEGAMTQQQAVIKPGQSFSMSMNTGVQGEPATAIRFSAESNTLVVASL